MSDNDNLEATTKGYTAFGDGNLDAAMLNFDDAIEWVQPGRSSISGTYRGKAEVTDFLMKLAGKEFSNTPKRFVTQDDLVIVLSEISVDGENAEGVEVYTFRDGKIVKAQSFGDTAMLERVFGSA